MKKLNERIRELRNDKDLTQKQLADIIGVSEDKIYFWEKGRTEPNADCLILLAQFFEVSSDYLLGLRDWD